MKSRPTSRPRRGWFLSMGLMLVFAAFLSSAADFMKFEAMLIWATSAENSPNPEHKPVPPDVRKKLEQLPLKWKNYFLVNSVKVSVPNKESEEATLSDKCKIDVKHIMKDDFEVSLIGRGEPVLKRTQKLSKGQMLVLGGNAPDETGWLVVLKRLE